MLRPGPRKFDSGSVSPLFSNSKMEPYLGGTYCCFSLNKDH